MKKSKDIVLILIGLILIFAGFMLINTTRLEGVMKSVPYVFIGLGCGLLGHGIGAIYQTYIYKKNPDIAKNMEIECKDERNIMIKNQAMAKGYQMMIYAFGILLLTYAFMGASLEIILPFVTVYVFVQIYALCIRIKKEKEL